MTPLRFAATVLSIVLAPSYCLGQTQTITFRSLSDRSLGTFTVNAAVTSGTVTFTSTTPSVCTVEGTTVSLIAQGRCSITASQEGGATPAATPVVQSFNVTTGGDPNSIPGVDAVIGVGSLITGNHTDYKVNSSTNILQGTQIGRASPQLLLGGAFQLPIPAFTPKSRRPTDPGYQPWHAFVSLKFSTSATQTIIGYTFGMTYRIMPKLDLLLGYALTPFNEPAPGFRRKAVLEVQQNPTVYPTFNAAALNNNTVSAFDGFPLQKQGTSSGPGVNLYLGDPLETHYRGGLMIGLSFPVSLNGILGIPPKQ